MSFAVDERADFLRLLDELRETDWGAATLCEGWSVRDVVAHVLSFEDLSLPAAMRLIVRGKVGRTSANELAMAPFTPASPADLTARMREHLRPAGLTAGFGGGIALTDGMIHQQDIRRPLGKPRTIPIERVLAALRIALRAPTLPSRRRVSRVRLVASDADWVHGVGPEVRGPVESLLMLTAGRGVAAAECSGPGVEVWNRS